MLVHQDNRRSPHRMGHTMKKILEKLVLAAALLPVIAFIFYITIPLGNTKDTHFDTLLVLGYPANPDGTPSPEQRERVLEAVRQYRAGVAPAIIVSGGAAHNQFVEADVMAKLAEASGVPASAIVEERRSLNTIENIANSTEIMQEHDWQSAEVITSPAHLRRGSYLAMYSPVPINWHMQSAPWPVEYNWLDKGVRYVYEVAACADMRIFGLHSGGFFRWIFRALHIGAAGRY